jgi:serine protease
MVSSWLPTALGQKATVSSSYTAPASGYDGTSRAAPHVSAFADLIWGADPTAVTNAKIRAVLQSTAQDLGAAGRDNYYCYGLFQAKTAINALTGGGTDPQYLHV